MAGEGSRRCRRGDLLGIRGFGGALRRERGREGNRDERSRHRKRRKPEGEFLERHGAPRSRDHIGRRMPGLTVKTGIIPI